MSRAEVELLYFAGCPGAETLLLELRWLAESAGARFRVCTIETVEAAQRERFLGSPTVRVDGIDVDPAAENRSDLASSAGSTDPRPDTCPSRRCTGSRTRSSARDREPHPDRPARRVRRFQSAIPWRPGSGRRSACPPGHVCDGSIAAAVITGHPGRAAHPAAWRRWPCGGAAGPSMVSLPLLGLVGPPTQQTGVGHDERHDEVQPDRIHSRRASPTRSPRRGRSRSRRTPTTRAMNGAPQVAAQQDDGEGVCGDVSPSAHTAPTPEGREDGTAGGARSPLDATAHVRPARWWPSANGSRRTSIAVRTCLRRSTGTADPP